MQMTAKQKEFWRECVVGYHRWCVTYGATRSGKTYLSYWFVARKTRELINKPGLAVILGNTKSTIERNILEPMRDIWGEEFIGNIQTNKVKLFGQLYHIVGAEKISGVSKIQGQAIKICIGDEVTTWNEEVFAMLKSRLDKEYSVFYGTCNPDHPNHWFKEFLDNAKDPDNGIDVFAQHYTIDDNDYLPDSFKKSLKAEYAGTVYYQRYILGLWVRAEGIIYSKFSADPSAYYVSYDEALEMGIQQINIGVDFGGTKSGQAFVATGILRGYKGIIALGSERHFGDIDPDKLSELFCDFVELIIYKYGRADYAYCDNAETVLVRGLRNAAEKKKLPITVKNAIKKPINDRIRAMITLINRGTFYYTDGCETVVNALSDAVWNEDVLEDERLDDGTTDVDSLDSLEYSIEREIKFLIDYRARG